MFRFLATSFIALTITTPLCLSAPPTDAAAPMDFSLSPVRISSLPPVTYVYKTFHGTYAELGAFSRQTLPELYTALQARHAAIAGEPLFVFKNPTADRNQVVDVQVGVPVRSDPHVADYAVRQIDEPRTASCVVSGAGGDTDAGKNAVGNACRAFYDRLNQQNLTPGNELQLQWLAWDEKAPANDVFRLAIPVTP